jgi:hypothetical protein
MDEAVRQYELVTAERHLLQRTVVGSIKALTDIMSLVSPAAVGCAIRLRRRVAAVATELGLEDRWQVEAAALLSQLGHVSLPDSVTYKLSRGRELDTDESGRLRQATRAANRLIAHVPRLEPVSAILRAVTEADDETESSELAPPDSVHVQILRLAMEVDRLESQGLPTQAILETVSAVGDYPPKLLDVLRKAQQHAIESMTRVEIPLAELEVGMIVDEDLLTLRDLLIAPRGCEVTPSFLEHIRHFTSQLPKPSVVVLKRSDLAMKAPDVVMD